MESMMAVLLHISWAAVMGVTVLRLDHARRTNRSYVTVVSHKRYP